MADTAEPITLTRPAPRVTLLGRFAVCAADGADLTPKSRKARALAAYVLMAGAPVGRERLKAMFWGDRGEDQAAASLRQALYELRDLTAEPRPLLGVDRHQVWAEHRGVCDVSGIEAAAARGDAAAVAAALGAGAEPLADLDGAGPEFDDWLRDERARLSERLLAAGLADALERVDPLSEPVVRAGMCADHAAGDAAALHRRYRRFEGRLAKDLGASPSDETRALFERLSAPGVAREATAPQIQISTPTPNKPRPRLLWGLAAALVLSVVAVLAAVFLRPAALAPAASPTVAVLPFTDSAPGHEDGYFATGVSEEVRDLLARGQAMRIVGSRSARLFGAEPDPVAAARRLAVDYVVQGEVRSAADRLVVNARLVRAGDGQVLWSARYDRPAEDVFAVQADIASAVAHQFGARLTQDANPHLVTRPEVYDRYLEARNLTRERREPALKEAQRLLKEAIAADPNYAPAFASLSQVTMLLSDHPSSYGVTPLLTARAEARAYAKRALLLAPDLGDAYAAYGLLSLSDAESMPFYARAVALDPQRSDFHRWYGQSLDAVGRHIDALAQYRRATALEPLWSMSTEHLAGELSSMGRRAEAQETAARFIRLSTDARGIERIRLEQLGDSYQMAAWTQTAAAAAGRLPGDRQAAIEWAKGLAILGETQHAAQVLPDSERVGHAVLAGGTSDLVAEAERQGVTFWDRVPNYWDFADYLQETGHGALLLKLYDARFTTPDEFDKLEGDEAPYVAAPVIAAMQDAGRSREAAALAALMLRRVDADAAQGMAPYVVAYPRAEMLALLGRRDEALSQLELAGRASWTYLSGVPFKPLVRRAAFRGLAADPRLAALDQLLRTEVNRQRALMSLAPLPA